MGKDVEMHISGPEGMYVEEGGRGKIRTKF